MTTFEGQPVTLAADGLACVRSERVIFQNLSFSLSSGEMLTLVGPNGSGKSSLLRQIAGLLDVPAGHVSLSGAADEQELGDLTLYEGHLDAVKAPLTVTENLAFWADYYGTPRDGVQDALAVFRLDHLADLPAGILSAGQKRRLGLCRLAAIERPLWLLDEPTVSLDAANVAILRDLMIGHLEKGGLIIAATHLDLGLEGTHRLELDRFGPGGRS